MKELTVVILGLWTMTLAGAQEEMDRASQMLPLAVGNSWEYWHSMLDSTMVNVLPFEQIVTISITHTEEIDGHTYYVFSDMPYDEPKAPFFFLAGKKVRFESNRLLERRPEGDVSLYQFEFDVFGGYTYEIPEQEQDTLVAALESTRGTRQSIIFDFQGHFDADAEHIRVYYFESRVAYFIAGFGLFNCELLGQYIPPVGYNDQTDVWNKLGFKSAVINGKKLEPWDVYETAIKANSWGLLKRNFSPQEMRD